MSEFCMYLTCDQPALPGRELCSNHFVALLEGAPTIDVMKKRLVEIIGVGLATNIIYDVAKFIVDAIPIGKSPGRESYDPPLRSDRLDAAELSLLSAYNRRDLDAVASALDHPLIFDRALRLLKGRLS